MISDFNAYTKFLIENKMSANQFLLCWLLETKELDLLKYYQEKVAAFKRSDIVYLIDNDFILNTASAGTYDAGNLVVLPKFTEALIIEQDVAFNEIWEMYPKTGTINGNRISLRNASLDDLTRIYGKIINKNKSKHKEIKSKTKKVIGMMRRGKINWMGIEKFITGRNWELADEDFEEGKGAFTEL